MKIIKAQTNVKTDLFDFSYGRDVDKLKHDIKTNGLYQTPYGIEVADEIQIYEGCTRHSIAGELSIDHDVIVKALSIKEAFLEKINLFDRKYNPIECAIIIEFANEHTISPNLFLKKLGINKDNVNRYLELLNLPKNIKLKTAREPAFLKVTQLLVSFDPEIRADIFNLMISYKLNVNQSYECCQVIEELILKDTSFSIPDLDGVEFSSSNIAGEFMAYLKTLRFPEYTQVKKELNSCLKTLNSKHLRYSYPDNFESNNIHISADIKTINDIDSIKDELNKKNPTITKLLSLIKNGIS